MERGGPCHISGPSRTGLILPKAQSRQQRGEHVDQPQPDAHPDAAEHPQAQDADEEYRVGVVGKRQQPLRLVPAQRTLAVQLSRGPGTDGVAAHQSQQQRGAADAVHPEQRLHQPCQPGGGQFSESQPQQQRGDHQKGKEGRDHRPGAQGQCCGDILPDLSGVRQKPHQYAAQKETRYYPPPRFHPHHPFTLCHFPGAYAGRRGQASSPPPLHTVAKR